MSQLPRTRSSDSGPTSGNAFLEPLEPIQKLWTTAKSKLSLKFSDALPQKEQKAEGSSSPQRPVMAGSSSLSGPLGRDGSPLGSGGKKLAQLSAASAGKEIGKLVNSALPSIVSKKMKRRTKSYDNFPDLEGNVPGNEHEESQSQSSGIIEHTDSDRSKSSSLRPKTAHGSGYRERPAGEEGEVVMGILSKYVNLGVGWGPRLFVLEDGVLSYYRLDGHERISLVREIDRRPGVKLIGEEIRKMERKERQAGAVGDHSDSKAHGAIHLQVSSLRASEADDRKFYVFSGTRTLDLRTETREDRVLWLDLLQGAKEKYRGAKSGQWQPEREEGGEAEQSLERLRSKLQHAGVAAEVIEECEEIVKKEVLLKLSKERKRRLQLQKRIGRLEVEKVELETAVVDESRHFAAESKLKPKAEYRLSDGDGEEEDEEDSKHVASKGSDNDGSFSGSEESEEDEFFEAVEDFVQQSMIRSESRRAASVDMDEVGFRYPTVKRRTSLPVPAEVEKPVSLWNIIKDCVGKDLSKVCLPVFFNEPISTLQKCCEELEYSWLLDRAAEYGRQGNQLMRALHVAAFALSGYACTDGRVQKPFNPLLGETYEADFPDKGFRFVSEKVVHQPPIVACHCEGKGWRFFGDCNLKIRFWGPSMQLDPLGVLTVEFEDGERYQWSKVTTGIYNIILGKLYIDHYGLMKINGNRGLSARLKFKEPSMLERNPHQVRGYIENAEGAKLATLIGKWDKHLHYVLGDAAKDSRSEREVLDSAVAIWEASELPPSQSKYKFTSHCITLNEITPGLQDWLPPTDSRLRPDQRALEDGRYDWANAEKLRLEQRQRKARKEQEEGWHPRWFQQSEPDGTWTYAGGYWERREKKDWSQVKDIFAKDPVVEESTVP